jgi:hypothetical protein
MRMCLGYLLAVLLCGLPLWAWAFTVTKPQQFSQAAAMADDVTAPSNQAATRSATSTSKTTSQVVLRTDAYVIGVSQADPSDVTVTIPSRAADPRLQESPLTRQDMESILGSIAPAGQKHAFKQEVCDQIIVQVPVANDIGTDPNALCSDANLSTYDAY